MIDDPRILKIIRTGYLSDPFEDVICESCQEVIYHGEWMFKICGIFYCERCLKKEFGKII